MVVQRIFRQHFVKFRALHLFVDERKRRVVQPHSLFIKGNQGILLRTEINCIAQRKAVFFLRRGRRVQLIIGGFQRCGQRAGKLCEHCLAPPGQVGVVPDDRLHGVTQGREDKAAFACPNIAFLFPRAKTVCASSGKHDFCALLLFAKLCLEIHIVFNDRLDFLCKRPARFPLFHLCQIGRVTLFFSPVQIAVGGDQLPDSFCRLTPWQRKLRVRLDDPAGADSDALRIMPFVQLPAGNCRIRAAGAVLLFQKRGVVRHAFPFQKLLIDAIFSVRNTAAPQKYRVNILLRNDKGGGLVILRPCDFLFLLCLCGQGVCQL